MSTFVPNPAFSISSFSHHFHYYGCSISSDLPRANLTADTRETSSSPILLHSALDILELCETHIFVLLIYVVEDTGITFGVNSWAKHKVFVNFSAFLVEVHVIFGPWSRLTPHARSPEAHLFQKRSRLAGWGLANVVDVDLVILLNLDGSNRATER
ncbi:hypothetical protein CC78DRAFT_577194 [Lojkania enalia]|uniref:Uncharacterized protein n=1 Tax=Lojkania enalia TaxID=147567 RepID=A0A9P4KGC5_9PLEO|nr:hypothetical protein CC78DRAFT_577194 [Didymosphaeria enalia]